MEYINTAAIQLTLIFVFFPSSSESPENYGFTKKGKAKKNKKAGKGGKDGKPVHMYSQYGVMQLDQETGSNEKMNARAARFAKEGKRTKKKN